MMAIYTGYVGYDTLQMYKQSHLLLHCSQCSKKLQSLLDSSSSSAGHVLPVKLSVMESIESVTEKAALQLRLLHDEQACASYDQPYLSECSAQMFEQRASQPGFLDLLGLRNALALQMYVAHLPGLGHTPAM